MVGGPGRNRTCDHMLSLLLQITLASPEANCSLDYVFTISGVRRIVSEDFPIISRFLGLPANCPDLLVSGDPCIQPHPLYGLKFPIKAPIT